MDKQSEPAESDAAQLAADCLNRCDVISGMSEIDGEITRRFLTEPIKQAHDFLRLRSQELGLHVRIDDGGNFIGRRLGTDTSKTLLIGSHLDTVPNGGKYDGLLGTLIGLAVVERIGAESLPMNIDVIGFSEEEGVRFSLPYIGSHAITGTFDRKWLTRTDKNGTTMRSAIESFGLNPDGIHNAAYDATEVVGFVEPHIEQGPLLYRVDRPVAMVTSIAGQSRLLLRFLGEKGHAGTAPMRFRNDALVAASKWIGEVAEQGRSVEELRATVGYVDASPNVRNVIADQVDVSLDVRHTDDSVRVAAVDRLLQSAKKIGESEGVSFEVIEHQAQPAVIMDDELCQLLRGSMASCDAGAFSMFSGAGHDAAVLAAKFPSTMLFIRQPSGISHHPDEDVQQQDVAVAIDVLTEFVFRIAKNLKEKIA